MLVSLSPDPSVSSPPPPSPNNCRHGYAQYGNSCLKINPRRMTFSDAVQACRNEGPDVNLASISDVYEQAYAETLVHGIGDVMVWLGLIDHKVTRKLVALQILNGYNFLHHFG